MVRISASFPQQVPGDPQSGLKLPSFHFAGGRRLENPSGETKSPSLIRPKKLNLNQQLGKPISKSFYIKEPQ